jgi:hypothetical protein
VSEACIKNNYFCRRYKKNIAGHFHDRFVPFAVKWLKHASRLTFYWFNSVAENLKSHPKQFWKYVSQFMKTNTDLIHLQNNGILIIKPRDIVQAFLEHFQSVYSSSSPETFAFINQSM